MAQNWKRILFATALVFAFLLVCGSIYLHLKQKHHLGRLKHDDGSIVITGGVAAHDVAIAMPFVNTTTPPTTTTTTTTTGLPPTKTWETTAATTTADGANEEEYDKASDENELNGADAEADDEDERDDEEGDNYDEDDDGEDDDVQDNAENDEEIVGRAMEMKLRSRRGAKPQSIILVDRRCLVCICKVLSENNCHHRESNAIGGGGGGGAQKDDDESECANDRHCRTIRPSIVNYFNENARDCNKDGIIDCIDLAAIQKYGPHECRSMRLAKELIDDLQNCLNQFEDYGDEW